MPPLLMNLLMFLGPQLGAGVSGQFMTRKAIAQDDMRLQIPGIQSRGVWTDMRLVGGGILSVAGTAMVVAKSPILKFFGLALISLGGVAFGSLGATEELRSKALEFRNKGAKPAAAPGRLSGDFMGSDFDMGADGCGPEGEFVAYEGEDGTWVPAA